MASVAIRISASDIYGIGNHCGSRRSWRQAVLHSVPFDTLTDRLERKTRNEAIVRNEGLAARYDTRCSGGISLWFSLRSRGRGPRF